MNYEGKKGVPKQEIEINKKKSVRFNLQKFQRQNTANLLWN